MIRRPLPRPRGRRRDASDAAGACGGSSPAAASSTSRKGPQRRTWQRRRTSRPRDASVHAVGLPSSARLVRRAIYRERDYRTEFAAPSSPWARFPSSLELGQSLDQLVQGPYGQVGLAADVLLEPAPRAAPEPDGPKAASRLAATSLSMRSPTWTPTARVAADPSDPGNARRTLGRASRRPSPRSSP